MEQQQEQQQQPAAAGNHLGKPLLSVAPMMDWTDVHYRQLARLISKHTWLWTEMVVDRTILHTDNLDKHLWFPPEQHPIVLQLGGSEPELLFQAAKAAAAYGYDELNLNCGCPSDRVAGAGCFGASLMLEPQLVGDCMAAVKAGAAAGGSAARISVKCRLGVDDADSYGQLAAFVQTVSERGGVTDFVIHARKCLLNGISPAQNRSVPPLRHDWVWALKRDFPHLSFQLNGGLTTTLAVSQALSLTPDASCGVGPGAIDGVMVGRAAYNDPWGLLGDTDVALFGAEANAAPNRRHVVAEYCKYGDAMLGRWRTREDGSLDPNVRSIIKPLLNLFHGERGGKRWKNAVDIALRTLHPKTVTELMDATLGSIPDEVLDAPPRSAAEAAAFANNGAAPEPYRLAVDRLAEPEDRARGDWEPKGKKKKQQAKAAARRAAAQHGGSSSAPASDSEGEEDAQKQQQEQGGSGEALQQQLQGLTLQQQRGVELPAQPSEQQQQGCGVVAPAGAPAAAAAVADGLVLQNGSSLQQQQQQQQQPQGEVDSAGVGGEGEAAAHAVTAVVA